MSRTISLCIAAVTLAIGMAFCAHAKSIPIDDFEDGNLDGWTLLDFSAAETWGPGDYDVSSGVLHALHSGSDPVPVGTPFNQTAILSIWNDSADPLYSNGYLRAQIRTDEDDNSTAVLMRADLGTLSGYLLFGNTNSHDAPGSGRFNLNKFVNGVESNIWRSDFAYEVGEWWNIELGTVGTTLSAKVWKVGDADPISPQFVGTDTSNTTGQIILSSDVSSAHTIPGRADGSFDNVSFYAIPEPSTVLLGFMGIAAVFGHRRRK